MRKAFHSNTSRVNGSALECGDVSPLSQSADMSDATTSHSTKESKDDC